MSHSNDASPPGGASDGATQHPDPKGPTMNLDTFLELAKAYTNLGWAVQEQFNDIANGESLEEQNPDALRMIADLLGRFDVADEYDEIEMLRAEIEEHLTDQLL